MIFAKRLTAAALFSAFSFTAIAQDSALKGIDTAELDRQAQPCDNFYNFSNGAWRAKNPIPASMDRWSPRWQAGENNKDQLRVILEKDAATPNLAPGSPAQLSGDFYAACTNTKAIDVAGLAPLQPMLDALSAVHTTADLQHEIAALQTVGVGAPFVFNGTSNLHDPTQIIAEVGAGGLSLPDRDYYLKPEPRFVKARKDYVAYVTHLLILSGTPAPQAASDANVILHFETELASASLDNVALRDPSATDHIVPFADLQRMTPHFDWTAFYASVHVAPGTVQADQPRFLAKLDSLLTSAPLADWKLYLRWQLLNNSAPLLSGPFVDAHFDFFEHNLAGVGEQKPRGTQCAEQADALLGEAVGQEYVKLYFTPEAKQRATVMVTNIIAAMHDTLSGLDWMSAPTKGKALAKLSSLGVKIGYPDHWKDYSSVKITRGDYFADAVAAQRFDVADGWATIGKPLDRSRWGFTPPTSNASYNPSLNEITFPAGILQPPAFSVHYTDAVNYGAIGVVIGHEISHGFDDQGAQFDAAGKLDNWWTPADLAKFHTKTGCVAHQFDGYTIDGSPDIHINGNLVLGESIADLAGLHIAYLAYEKTPEYKEGAKVDGFTPSQQFFLAWGQFRGDETRPEMQKLMVQGDPHPVAKYRVLGPLSNMPSFAQAFGCKAGPMVRPAADRCVVW